MADVFMYADETGNLDFKQHEGASRYFGIATATTREHGTALNEALALRMELPLHKGYFHACDDSHTTRKQVFDLLSNQCWRFDATMLNKANADEQTRHAGDVALYRRAWYLHFKQLAPRVSTRGDRLYVIAATLGTNARKSAFETALDEVCHSDGRDVHLCHWPAATSWGLQVADYAAWAIQRWYEKNDDRYRNMIADSVATCYAPWDR